MVWVHRHTDLCLLEIVDRLENLFLGVDVEVAV
jgi:hypothetical protein